MKIYFSPSSPFVRKCLVVAHELGLADQIERLPSKAHPVEFDREIAQTNPLGQVPTLFTDSGQALYDSRVICEYLNDLGNGDIFPKDSGRRWIALTDQSLADGILNAALLLRYEIMVRPEEMRHAEWSTALYAKMSRSLAHFEALIAGRRNDVDIGTITLGCTLSYLDFRFGDWGWRGEFPALADWSDEFEQRPSMASTKPPLSHNRCPLVFR